jgi:hypothetical protein
MRTQDVSGRLAIDVHAHVGHLVLRRWALSTHPAFWLYIDFRMACFRMREGNMPGISQCSQYREYPSTLVL